MFRKTKPVPRCRVVGSFLSSILTRRYGVGLTDIPFSRMQQVIGPDQADTVNALVDLGFPFYLNGTVYSQIRVGANGWIGLGSSAAGVYFGTPARPATIKGTIASGALLCPWCVYTQTVAETMPTYGPLGGVYYCHDQSQGPSRAVVRWVVNNYNKSPNTNNVALVFECVLYESNGKVEFRYGKASEVSDWGAKVYEAVTIGGGVCGVFLTGTDVFRDFTRDNCQYRGAKVDGGYTYQEGALGAKNFYYGCRYNPTSDGTLVRTWIDSMVYVFEPLEGLQQNLPKQDIRRLDAAPYIGRSNGLFNDQKVLVYGTASLSTVHTCSFPTRLPECYTGIEGGSARNFANLQSSIVATSPGGVSKEADYWLQSNMVEQDPGADCIGAFDESCMHDQSPSIKSTDFYLTGSDPAEYMLGFSQNIGAKEIIRIRLPVLSETLLRPTTASMYYYDAHKKAVLEYGTGTPPIDPGGEYFPGAMADAKGFTPLGTVSSAIKRHDFNRYFTKYLTEERESKTLAHPGCADGFGFEFNSSRRATALMEQNTGLPAISGTYEVATSGTIKMESFIDQPFLVEKVIMSVPIAAGPGWLEDRTRTKRTAGFEDYYVPPYGASRANTRSGSLCLATADWPLDVGGPCVTVGLMNQLTVPGYVKARDLIVTGTIIPTGDDVATVHFEKTYTRTINEVGGGAAAVSCYSITQEGFRAFNLRSSTVIAPNTTVGGSSFFTGSAVVNMDVRTSNGFVVFSRVMTGPTGSDVFNYGNGGDAVDGTSHQGLVWFWYNYTNTMSIIAYDLSGAPVSAWPYLGPYGSEMISLEPIALSFPTFGQRIASTNPMGRSNLGLYTSGRSIRDMAGVETVPVKNVLYPFKDQILTHMWDTYNAEGTWTSQNPGGVEEISKNQYTPDVATVVESSQLAPYILMPKDQLVLFLSKYRPVKSASLSHLWCEAGKHDPIKPGDITNSIAAKYAVLTGSHDIRVISGTIDVILIGSYVREGVEV